MKTFTVVTYNPHDMTPFVFSVPAHYLQEAAAGAWKNTEELNVVAVFQGEPERVDDLTAVAEGEDDIYEDEA